MHAAFGGPFDQGFSEPQVKIAWFFTGTTTWASHELLLSTSARDSLEVILCSLVPAETGTDQPSDRLQLSGCVAALQLTEVVLTCHLPMLCTREDSTLHVSQNI